MTGVTPIGYKSILPSAPLKANIMNKIIAI